MGWRLVGLSCEGEWGGGTMVVWVKVVDVMKEEEGEDEGEEWSQGVVFIIR